ncbi:MAG TPA: DUF2505 domain-containing protein [Nevskiaceae bacterium]|nr:DUF2505 domain-containing protein [Nevskiaceae bacterium]
MKFDDKHGFDQPASTILRMFSDRSYFERKYAALGARELEVLEHELKDDRFRIKCRMVMKSDAPLPDFAKKFLGDTVTITQQDSWDLKTQTGRIEAEIKGAPVKVRAEMALKAEGKGCANHLRWEVNCGIPLVGGKLEKVIAEDIQVKSKNDLAASRQLAAGY